MSKARMASDHTRQVRDLWDSRAEDWPGRYTTGQLSGRLPLFSGELRARLAAGEVLDLGCGSGELALHLASLGYAVTACDISAQMLGRAAAADSARAVAWTRLGPDWTTLPFTPASRDAVVAASVLEYVPDVSLVLRECARVLRPGGLLLCTVPDMSHPVRWGEGPARLIAVISPARVAAARMWPRLGSHLSYLHLSRQRHSARWWQARGRQAGLEPASALGPTAPSSRLRLLIFTRSG